jgi:ankyrin repeat protein
MTPLMMAALYGGAEAARLLLARGADVNAGAGEIKALRLASVTPRDYLKEVKGKLSDDDRRMLSVLKATAPGRAAVAELLRRAGAK